MSKSFTESNQVHDPTTGAFSNLTVVRRQAAINSLLQNAVCTLQVIFSGHFTSITLQAGHRGIEMLAKNDVCEIFSREGQLLEQYQRTSVLYIQACNVSVVESDFISTKATSRCTLQRRVFPANILIVLNFELVFFDFRHLLVYFFQLFVSNISSATIW